MMEDPRKAILLSNLRRSGIADERVLAAMAEVPRENFVENAFADQAYADQALPMSCGQTISQPFIVALMTEALDVAPGHRVVMGLQARPFVHCPFPVFGLVVVCYSAQ